MKDAQENRIRKNLKTLSKKDLIDLFLNMFTRDKYEPHSRIKIRSFEVEANESLSKTKKVMEELLKKHKRIDRPDLRDTDYIS